MAACGWCGRENPEGFGLASSARLRRARPADFGPLSSRQCSPPSGGRRGVVGGWALDAALGRDHEHHDIDVAVLRPDQLELQRALGGSDLRAIEFPGPGCGRGGRASISAASSSSSSRGRRGRRRGRSTSCSARAKETAGRSSATEIALPVESVGFVGSDGVSYLRPEVVMMHKAVSATWEPKDDEDLRAVLEMLDPPARAWLGGDLPCRPDDPWLEAHLTKPDTSRGQTPGRGRSGHGCP